MPDISGLLKKTFQSPTHDCSSYHSYNFWIPELALPTLNLPSQIRHTTLFLKKKTSGIFFYIPYAETTESNKRYQLENFTQYANFQMMSIIYEYTKNLVIYKDDVNFTKFPILKKAYLVTFLMPGGNKKVTHTYTKLQLKGAGLFKYV